jgi:hypothetical protein
VLIPRQHRSLFPRDGVIRWRVTLYQGENFIHAARDRS